MHFNILFLIKKNSPEKIILFNHPYNPIVISDKTEVQCSTKPVHILSGGDKIGI